MKQIIPKQLNLPFNPTETQMATQHIADILNKPATEIDKPKPLPVGSYVWSIQGMPRFDKSKEKQTPFYEFSCKCISALEDVGEDDLTDWATKADGSMRALNDVTRRLTFYITPDSVYRLQDFLVHCGIDGDGKTIRQCIDDTPNCQFVGSIVHIASQDGERIFDNIGKTAPTE